MEKYIKNNPSLVNLPFTTLLLLISFASVNAVLFTPGLPNIAHYFSTSNSIAQQTITWFLIGYAIGQLIYGPFANRFGRKPVLYAGISLQIFSSILCVLSGMIQSFSLLIVGRFLLAIGSGVGLIITFTLVSETFEPKIATQKISYLMLAFAITPGLSIALGGFLNTHYGWMSCFYLSAIYGLVLLFLVTTLTETKTTLDLDALKTKSLIRGYLTQFKNAQLFLGGLLMGTASCFIYVFATLAPFIAINLLNMNSTQYGIANLLPTLGLVIGSLLSASYGKKHSPLEGIKLGIFISGCSIIMMVFATYLHARPLLILFFPTMLIFLSISLIYSNASTIAMLNNPDKAEASAVMNFINMGFTTLIIISLSLFETTISLLPITYIFIISLIFSIYKFFSLRNIET
jgi:MFS family permease